MLFCKDTSVGFPGSLQSRVTRTVATGLLAVLAMAAAPAMAQCRYSVEVIMHLCSPIDASPVFGTAIND
jgi:hypothetical protein